MLPLELVKIAWRSLGVNKLRSALTVSGITAGVFSVVCVMTTVSALQNSIETGLTFLGSNVFQFAKYPGTINTQGDDRFRNRRNIDYHTYLTFLRLMADQPGAISPKAFDRDVQAVFADRKTNPNLRICGTNQSFLSTNNYAIGIGRNLSSEDVEFYRSVCVVGRAIVDRLFPLEEAVGKTIRLDGKAYKVVGSFAPKGKVFGGNEDNTVIIPITTFFENYGSKNRTINIAVQARSQTVYKRTMNCAVGAFRQARGLRAEDANDFEMDSNDSLQSAFQDIAHLVEAGAFALSTLALIAAGVGIMNIMLVNVTERTQEIGVRKSLGAKRRDIRLQFICEALLLSCLGGVCGSVLGVTVGDIVATLLNASWVFPWGWIALGILVCSGIGIIFGLYPAHRAASLDPIEALRC